MNSLFPPELRTASVVQRWNIVRTLNPDSVAEHSFYVTFYALQIARLVEWQGPLADLTFVALMHDVGDGECITGDLASPVKHEIVDEGKFNNFVSEQMRMRMPLVETQLAVIMESAWGSSIERIIKVADKIDAVIFLILEQRMGNVVLGPLYQDALKNLSEAWTFLGLELHEGDIPQSHANLWNDQVWPAIQSHWKHGGVGVQ